MPRLPAPGTRPRLRTASAAGGAGRGRAAPLRGSARQRHQARPRPPRARAQPFPATYSALEAAGPRGGMESCAAARMRACAGHQRARLPVVRFVALPEAAAGSGAERSGATRSRVSPVSPRPPRAPWSRQPEGAAAGPAPTCLQGLSAQVRRPGPSRGVAARARPAPAGGGACGGGAPPGSLRCAALCAARRRPGLRARRCPAGEGGGRLCPRRVPRWPRTAAGAPVGARSRRRAGGSGLRGTPRTGPRPWGRSRPVPWPLGPALSRFSGPRGEREVSPRPVCSLSSRAGSREQERSVRERKVSVAVSLPTSK